MNPAHLYYIPKVIKILRDAGAHDEQIAYLTLYQGQLSLMLRHQTPALTMTTVDKALDRGYEFVLLDLVTPGGRFYPLGFTTDVRRMCVALSRAKIGMLIFDDRCICQGNTNNHHNNND